VFSAIVGIYGGESFCPILRLGANGTLTNTEEGGGAAEGGEIKEEEALGEAECCNYKDFCAHQKYYFENKKNKSMV
jgi:hypothetical protein